MGAFFYHAMNSTNTSRMGRGTPHILTMGHHSPEKEGKRKEREKENLILQNYESAHPISVL